MKLIRRKRKPTPAQKALDIAKTVVRGLAAVRVARTAFKTYKIVRHLPQLALVLAIGGAVFAAVRKLRQRGGGPETETWSPPASPAPSSTPAASAASAASNGGGAPIAAAATAAGAAPDAALEPELHANPAETAATGTPPVELAEAGEPPHVEPVDELPAAGTVDAPAETVISEDLAAAAESSAPATDIPELEDDVASDAVPAPDAEPGPADRG